MYPFQELFIYLTHFAFKYLCTHLHRKLLNLSLMDLFFQDSQLKEDIQEVDLKELNVDGLSNFTELKLLDDLGKSLFVVFILSITSNDQAYVLWTCRKQSSFFQIFLPKTQNYIHIPTFPSFFVSN